MTVIRSSTVMQCTPGQAFDYLSDMRNELEWNPAAQLVEKLTIGPIGSGPSSGRSGKGDRHLR